MCTFCNMYLLSTTCAAAHHQGSNARFLHARPFPDSIPVVVSLSSCCDALELEATRGIGMGGAHLGLWISRSRIIANRIQIIPQLGPDLVELNFDFLLYHCVMHLLAMRSFWTPSLISWLRWTPALSKIIVSSCRRSLSSFESFGPEPSFGIS